MECNSFEAMLMAANRIQIPRDVRKGLGIGVGDRIWVSMSVTIQDHNIVFSYPTVVIESNRIQIPANFLPIVRERTAETIMFRITPFSIQDVVDGTVSLA